MRVREIHVKQIRVNQGLGVCVCLDEALIGRLYEPFRTLSLN